MHDDLDAIIARLAVQPLPLRLNGLEAGVARRLRGDRAAPLGAWRYAAVGLALVAGLGVGGAAATFSQTPMLAADLSGGLVLAPSTLLDAST